MGDFFGNGGGQRGERDVARGADIVMELWVTLEELYVGNFVEVSIYFKKNIITVHISSWLWILFASTIQFWWSTCVLVCFS